VITYRYLGCVTGNQINYQSDIRNTKWLTVCLSVYTKIILSSCKLQWNNNMKYFGYTFLLFFCRGDTFHKSLRLHRFKSDQDEILQDCSSSKYASNDGVGFLIRRYRILSRRRPWRLPAQLPMQYAAASAGCAPSACDVIGSLYALCMRYPIRYII